MADREQFLKRIADRLGRDRRHNVELPEFQENPWDEMYANYAEEDYLNLFIENLTALTGNALKVTNPTELSQTIEGIIKKENVKTAILWKEKRLEELSLQQALTEKGVFVKVWDSALAETELVGFAEQADIGFTFAEMGLAETGSVLLYNQGDLGRSVSLLPRVYAAILRKEDIKPRVTSALKQIREKHQTIGLPSLINLITGPSRSADIEMSLSIGVHGPGTVYVIVLDY